MRRPPGVLSGQELEKMAPTISTLQDVRRALTCSFEDLAIFKRSRTRAMYNFLAVLETQSFLADVRGADSKGLYGVNRLAVEASSRAVPALMRLCNCVIGDEPTIDEEIFGDAHELYLFSHGYETVEYCLGLAERGQFAGTIDATSNEVEFSYLSPDESASDTLLRSAEIEEHIVDNPSRAALEEMIGAVVVVGNELRRSMLYTTHDAITYSYSPELVAAMRQWTLLLEKAQRWEFPTTLRVGPTSFGDLRKFWSSLTAICNTHGSAQMIACQSDFRKWPIRSAVNLRPREEWLKLIAELSGLSMDVASEWLSWYTFDTRLRQAAPYIRVLIEVAPGMLAATGTLVTMSSVERNFLKLAGVSPELRPYYSGIASAKETIALEHILSFFAVPSFAAAPRVRIEGVTDADLVIYELATKFMLIVQHKWLTAPDELNESIANDERLTEGVGQALASRDSLRSDAGPAGRALQLPVTEVPNRIEAVVVCRGSEPTGFLPHPAVPVVTELAFEKMATRVSNLSELWELLNARPDHAEAASGFRDVKHIIRLGGFKFTIPALSA